MDTTIVILKFVGLAIAGAIGLLSFFTTKNWEERDIATALFVPGQAPKKKRRLTQWGKWSLVLLISSGLVTLFAQVTESVRTRNKELAEIKERENDRARVATEKEQERERFAREKEDDRKQFEAGLRKERERYEASTAEFILLKNDLERQRMQVAEAINTGKVDPKSISPFDPLPSSPSIAAAFEDAFKGIPPAVKEVAIMRNKEALERIPVEAKAREIEEICRPQMIRVIDLYRKVLARAQTEGLVTIKDLGPAPALPGQVVFSTRATNNPHGSIAEDIAQMVEFVHGDRWHAYLVIGLLDSTNMTNSAWYPKLRYKDRANTVGTIWFDPSVGDMMYESGRGRQSATSVVGVVTSVVKDLKMSRIEYLKR